jgi:hypothetical protein
MVVAISPDVGLKLEEHFNEVVKMSRTGQRKIPLLTHHRSKNLSVPKVGMSLGTNSATVPGFVSLRSNQPSILPR